MVREEDLDRLVDASLAARENAYAPYSQFQVGAAILARSGRILVGCNVENASYGLAICAERNAVGAAVAGNERDWLAIAVASRGAVTPCGACRQVLLEFSNDFDVLLVDADSRNIAHRWAVADLLPGAFHLKS